MRTRSISSLLRSTTGAVAPTVALSLFALIGAGGIAFDYARMASVDTELQQAADQAALAAATQLDQSDGSIQRATAAAQALLANSTLLANDDDDDGRAVTVPTVVFYETKADAESDTNGTTDVADFATAHFVRVAVKARRANFALTPIVGAISSGDINAEAVAGLGSAICKVPPLMMCNPQETGTNKDFDISGYIGRGLRLVSGGNSGSSWAPGNFGYLQTTGPGANALEYALGANNPPGDCFATDGVTTKPGENTSVVNAINTRFDIFQSGLTNDCNGSKCSPALNVRKDVVHPDISAIKGKGALNCGYNTGSDPWTLPSVRYEPLASTRTQTTLPTNMGLPRDICHAVSISGDCGGTASPVGDGNWDRTMYFKVNHPTIGANWATNASLTDWADEHGVADVTKITRYQVYQWEIDSGLVGTPRFANMDSKGKTNLYAYSGPQCSAGLGASETTPDRRLTSMAVVNCVKEGVKGQAAGVKVVKWVEVFFVEPSIDRPGRTNAGDVYVEFVRVTDPGVDASGGGQVVRRDVPYLIK
jgi:Flp pilus assembly protein TadG